MRGVDGAGGEAWGRVGVAGRGTEQRGDGSLKGYLNVRRVEKKKVPPPFSSNLGEPDWPDETRRGYQNKG